MSRIYIEKRLYLEKANFVAAARRRNLFYTVKIKYADEPLN